MKSVAGSVVVLATLIWFRSLSAQSVSPVSTAAPGAGVSNAVTGVPDVTGPQFRRVSWSKPERAGLLGHGSVAMVTSRHQHGVDAAYTTPATRAKWVRLHFFGAPLPSGFPGAYR